MNLLTATTNDDRYEVNFAPFQPTTNQEEIVAAMIRRMLHFHIFCVQLNDARPNMDQHVARRIRREGTKARVEGFRLAEQASKGGVRISYDDDMLRREAINIAYAIGRFEIEDAMALEEEVVAIAVTHSLYGTDLEALRIAA